MDSNPKISVIVPVYRAENFLDKCLSSLCGQTYQNLEIILVDDGSPDNSPALCDRWAEKDSRIKVIHKENGGVSSARNAGLDAAGGGYIGFVDSDDWIEPDMYAFLLEKLLEQEADVADCNYTLNYPGGSEIKYDNVFYKITETQELTRYFGIGGLYENAVVTKLYQADILKRHRFDESVTFMEDALFCVELAPDINTYVKYPNHKYHYYQNSNSAVQSAETAAYDAVAACDRILMNPYIQNDPDSVLKMRKKRICMIFMTYNKNSMLKNHDECKKLRKLLLEEKSIWFSCGLSAAMKGRLLLIWLCPGLFRIAEPVVKSLKRRLKGEI